MSKESITNLLIEFNKLSPDKQERFLDSMEKYAQAVSDTERKVEPRHCDDFSTDIYYVLSLISSVFILIDHVFEEASGREETVDRHCFVASDLLSKAIETLENIYNAMI